MDETLSGGLSALNRSIPDWFLTVVRLVVAALVAKPALSKFLTYGNSVAFFTAIGMPYPTVMVFVAGVIEVAAVVLLLFGTGGRLAALSLVPVMLVAIVYVGPDWKNLSVLLGSLGIVALGTGTYSLEWPRERFLG